MLTWLIALALASAVCSHGAVPPHSGNRALSAPLLRREQDGVDDPFHSARQSRNASSSMTGKGRGENNILARTGKGRGKNSILALGLKRDGGTGRTGKGRGKNSILAIGLKRGGGTGRSNVHLPPAGLRKGVGLGANGVHCGKGRKRHTLGQPSGHALGNVGSSMATIPCADYVWKDILNFTCAHYALGMWCSASSADAYGPAWEEHWGTFDVYASGLLAANNACCACGGGVTTWSGMSSPLAATGATVDGAWDGVEPGSSDLGSKRSANDANANDEPCDDNDPSYSGNDTQATASLATQERPLDVARTRHGALNDADLTEGATRMEKIAQGLSKVEQAMEKITGSSKVAQATTGRTSGLATTGSAGMAEEDDGVTRRRHQGFVNAGRRFGKGRQFAEEQQTSDGGGVMYEEDANTDVSMSGSAAQQDDRMLHRRRGSNQKRKQGARHYVGAAMRGGKGRQYIKDILK